MKILETDTVVLTTVAEHVGTISSDHFGAIVVNSFGYHYFEDHTDNLGLTDIRFPGGTVSESGFVVDGRIRLDAGEISPSTLTQDRSSFAFDLTHPELISPIALEYDDVTFLNRDDIGTFSQALDLANTRGVSLGLIIPVQRYFENVDFSDIEVRQHSIDLAVSDIQIFLERLKNGEYNNGEYPQKITFEIGNEPYQNPIEYAVIAKAMIDEIDRLLADSDISYDIAIQMGRGGFEFNNLVDSGYFEKFFQDPSDLIPGLEHLSFRPGDALPYAVRQIAIDEMMTGILGDSLTHVDSIRHHVLSFKSDLHDRSDAPLYERTEIVDFWYEQFQKFGRSRDDVDYYVSAWTTASVGPTSIPYSMSAAASTLELFSYFMEAGVDRAAVWGVVGAFKYSDDILDTVVTDRLSPFLSPQASVLQLMAENIIDSQYLGVSGTSDQGYVSYTYEDASSYTLFFVAGQLKGGDLQVTVNLGLFGSLESVSVTNLDVKNGAPGGAARIHVADQQVEDGKLKINFDQDFEIAMIKLQKTDSDEFQIVQSIESFLDRSINLSADSQILIGGESQDQLLGGEGTDILVGGGGDDVLDAGPGRAGMFHNGMLAANFYELGAGGGSFLFGGGGNDLLWGGAGNDLLAGGDGDDQLWGGGGFDTFVFTKGNDVIHDFERGVDSILIDEELLAGLPIELWLRANASLQEDSLMLDFGQHGSLTILGHTDIEYLISDIRIEEFDSLF